MAEGVEETENNNAETPAMLGTVLPCEAMTASLGGVKRDFDSISAVQQLSPPAPSIAASILTSTTTTATTSNNNNNNNNINNNNSSTSNGSGTISQQARAITKSPPSPSLSSSSTSSSSGNVQHHPINLKSEDCEKDFCHRLQTKSPSISTSTSSTADSDKGKCSPSEFYKNLGSSNGNGGGSCSDRLTPHHHHRHHHHEQSKVAATAAAVAAAAAQAHLNGTMQDMINLQKLQNLASMQQHQQQQQQHHQHQHQQQQQQQQQHSSSVPVAAALASLQGLAGISSATALNSPLNLSVGSSSNLSLAGSPKHHSSGALGGNGAGLIGCSPPGSSQMPQLILASGQLVQGVQGAQLLIPTSQGIAVQTILTIPVSQQINTNEQFLQNYAALNSGAGSFSSSPLVPTTSQIPPQLQAQSNFLKPNLFSPGVQQLLAALHPQLFSTCHLQAEPIRSPHHQHQQTAQSKSHLLSQVHAQQALGGSSGSGGVSVYHHSPADSISPKLESVRRDREKSPSASSITQHLRASPLSNLNTVSQPKQSPPSRNSNFGGLNLSQEKSSSAASSPPTTTNNAAVAAAVYSSTSGSQMFHSQSPNSHIPPTNNSHSLSSQVNSPSSACVLSSINRLTSSNSELTITKSHGLSSSSLSSSVGNHSMNASTSSPSPGPPGTHQQSQSMKLSPSSMQISPAGTEASTNDLLVDSPNEPTINQTNCNVVDGIDLDEIKEFAKAFKLRRLSLGLTQTQVGQALSVTEGPAYSQSAICSALAAQMYAAQLSSQQQNMFEKLDITPKSAQKIKPVLERWMKEAEESHWNRYKTGQNHLTDFIGVEPSKKRKRRTSFTPQALELLNAHFERNTHPSGTEITGLAHQLGYEREVIRIWFCNKRQALKNTVRMMSKGMV